MKTRWTGLLVGALASFGLNAGCGDDCSRPRDCDFGELCFDGQCVASATLDRTCGTSADCVDPQFPTATAQCVAGRCQLRLDRPEITNPDAGTGGGDGGVSDGGDAGAPITCNPADETTCPTDQTCLIDAMGDTQCVPEGTAAKGETCTVAAPCQHEFICLDLGSGPVCWEGCDPANDDCTAPETCTTLSGVTYGVCE